MRSGAGEMEMAKKRGRTRRRAAATITLTRAARLFQLVRFLASGPQPRDQVQHGLGIGLRTFYRELELLKRLGVRIQFDQKTYRMVTSAEEAEARLPFPDPHLTFAEMRVLASCPGEVGARLGALYREVLAAATHPTDPRKKKPRGRRRGSRSIE
jgi:predicted DNA-binding transcriptional regulator YafY